jgi:FkbM family methyltransferase
MGDSSPKRAPLLRRARYKRRRAQRRLQALLAAVRFLGPRGAALFWSQLWGLPYGRSAGGYTLRAKGAAHPLVCRAHSSDGDVFRNVFVEQAYACVEQRQDVRLIIDCGANVGYASAYLLTRHPRAEVLAVEPDAGNFAALQLNTAPYAGRIKALRAAVWSHAGTLAIEESNYRDGREWSKQVREARPGELDGLPAVTIDGLLAESGHERISILKVDIEGAEAVVFAEGCEAWLARVDNLLIELHDDSEFGDCRSVFERAIAEQDFTVSQLGNLTICRRAGQAVTSS